MSVRNESPVPVRSIESNALPRLQLKIARRADQLSRLVISDPATDVALWLQAEEEVFGSAGVEPALRAG
jgi:hypothetical protein